MQLIMDIDVHSLFFFFSDLSSVNINVVGYGQHTRWQIHGRTGINCAFCLSSLSCNQDISNRFHPWCQFTFIFLCFIFWSKYGSQFKWNLIWRPSVEFSLQWHRKYHPNPTPSSGIPTLFFQPHVYLRMQLSHVVFKIGSTELPLSHHDNGRCP